MRKRTFFLIAVAVIVADRTAKLLAAGLPPEGITLIPGIVGLRYAENRGIAFSLLGVDYQHQAFFTFPGTVEDCIRQFQQ